MQVEREKQVLEPPKAKNRAPIVKARVEQSKRKASNENPVTSSQAEMKFFEDTADLETTKFDGSFFKKGFDKQTDKEVKTRRRLLFAKNTESVTVTPVVSNKSEVVPVTSTDDAVNTFDGSFFNKGFDKARRRLLSTEITETVTVTPLVSNKSDVAPIKPTDDAVNTTSSSTEGETSFMTVSFSLDDSILTAEVLPSDGKRTEEPLFLCGLPQAVMFEIHCHSNVLNAVSYSFSEAKNYLNSITDEPKHRSGRSKTSGSKGRAKRELRSSKSLLM